MFADPDDLAIGTGGAGLGASELADDLLVSESDFLRDEGVHQPPDAVDLVVEVADMMSVFAAERLVRIAALLDERVGAFADGRTSREIIERSARLELAAAMRITEYAAGQLLALAEAVTHRYRPILGALSRASVTERHAQHLVEALDALEPEHRDVVLTHGLALAEAEPVGSFRRSLARLVERVRNASIEVRHADAVAQRRVVVEHAPDGMAWLSAFLPAVEAHAIHGRLTAMAKAIGACEAESRTTDQLRADALADLLIDGETHAHPVEARGIRASVVVTVPALALLESKDTAQAGGLGVETDGSGDAGGDSRGSHGAMLAGCDTPTVEGIGPIPLSVARELCGGAVEWMRVLTHPESGAVLSVGREKYQPPPSLRRLVKWRAERCMAPGCGMPASRCQIDHSIAWEHGGFTSLENLAPLCQGHHTVKHHGRWIVRQIAGSGGALEWISPAGRRYVVTPERRVPVFRASPSDVPAPF